MTFKKTLTLLLTCSMAFAAASALAEDAQSMVIPTTQSFSDEEVADADLTTILNAGLSAASAINQQPWRFAVVKNKELMAEIAGGSSFSMPAGASADGSAGESADAPSAENTEMPSAPAAVTATARASIGDSPVAVIICMDPNTSSPDPDFDCGLACERMIVAADALGYSTKVISSPTMTLNGDQHDALCEKLGIDTSMQAVAVLLIGKADPDAVTSASVRNDFSSMVSIIE